MAGFEGTGHLGEKSQSMSFHPRVLKKRQAEVLRLTSPLLQSRRFQLGGGTALALQMGHRYSADFDWFTVEHLRDPLGLAQQLRDQGISLKTTSVAQGTFHGEIEGVRFSLLEYRYPLLRDPVQWPEFGCALLSLDDIACMKLAAIAQRGLRRDFVDIYALASKHAPLSKLLSLYRKKYSVEDTGHVLFALAYFDDADRERDPSLLWDVDWGSIKEEIRGWLRDLSSEA